MEKDTRIPFPLSELRVGLKCGGSDGLSGVTANPLLGMLSDFLIAQGATTVLTEVPEMFGGETILMDRAENEATFQKIVKMVNDFKEYYLANGQNIYENPSPGNKAGGISTLEDKSLGCIQKGGTASVTDVLDYTGTLKRSGLNLLSAPGNDLVASTALGAAGCHMVLFSTGRGTPYATFVPTVKISTNTQIYEKKPHWMDFNAAEVLEKGFDMVLRDLIDQVLALASGRMSVSEQAGYKEIAIFKTGVTL
jgi:altronate hydrolase